MKNKQTTPKTTVTKTTVTTTTTVEQEDEKYWGGKMVGLLCDMKKQ